MAYNKVEIKKQIDIDNIFDLLQELGGEPQYTDFGLISATICHNPRGQGSHKLYYYENSGLFYCYSGCAEPSFDIFQLVMKVADIQWNKAFDLNDAIRWVAFKLGIVSNFEAEEEIANKQDWSVLDAYERIGAIELKDRQIVLPEYDSAILDKFNYNLKITPWLKEGIAQEAIDKNKIGFYPGKDQITIPHFDKGGKLVGLRGRTMCKAEAEIFGKYRPMRINQQLYNHPLGFNLYNLNNSKDNIKTFGTAIVFESEKSCLMYQSYFGAENDISVACCGSSLSAYQVQLLTEAGAKNIIIAFDRDFENYGDDTYNLQIKKYKKLNDKYKSLCNLSFIFDKNNLLDIKCSPIDKGPEIFTKLYEQRVFI